MAYLTYDDIVKQAGITPTTEQPGLVSSSLQKGFANTAKGVGGALEFLGATDTGRTVSKYWEDKRQQLEKERATKKFGDIDGVGSALEYGTEQVLQALPFMALTGGIGGGLGSIGVKGAQALGAGLNAQKAAAVAGGMMASPAVETGLIYADQDPNAKDRTQAVKAGIPAGLLDSAGMLANLKYTGLGKNVLNWMGVKGAAEGAEAVAQPLWKTLPKAAAVGFASEAPTESAQSPLEQWGAGKPVFQEGKSFLDAPVKNAIGALSGGMLGAGNYTPEMRDEMFESFMGGGVVGGVMGGGGQGVSSVLNRPTKPVESAQPNTDASRPGADLIQGESVDDQIRAGLASPITNLNGRIIPPAATVQPSLFGEEELGGPVTGQQDMVSPELSTPVEAAPQRSDIDLAAEAEFKQIENNAKTLQQNPKAKVPGLKGAYEILKSRANMSDPNSRNYLFETDTPEIVAAKERDAAVADATMRRMEMSKHGFVVDNVRKGIQERKIKEDQARAVASKLEDERQLSLNLFPTKEQMKEANKPIKKAVGTSTTPQTGETAPTPTAPQSKRQFNTQMSEYELQGHSIVDAMREVVKQADSTLTERNIDVQLESGVNDELDTNLKAVIRNMNKVLESEHNDGKYDHYIDPTTKTITTASFIKGALSTRQAAEESIARQEDTNAEAQEELFKDEEVEKPAPKAIFGSKQKARITDEGEEVAPDVSNDVLEHITATVNKMTGGKTEVKFKKGFIEITKEDGTLLKLSGSTKNNIIKLALGDKNISKYARHEVIHALRDMNLFTEPEYEVLRNKARKVWVKQFNLQQYSEFNLDENALLDEAIAMAFESDIKDSILDRIRDFFERIRNFLADRGYTSASDVFRSVEAGLVGARVVGHDINQVTQAKAAITREKFVKDFSELFVTYTEPEASLTGITGEFAKKMKDAVAAKLSESTKWMAELFSVQDISGQRNKTLATEITQKANEVVSFYTKKVRSSDIATYDKLIALEGSIKTTGLALAKKEFKHAASKDGKVNRKDLKGVVALQEIKNALGKVYANQETEEISDEDLPFFVNRINPTDSQLVELKTKTELRDFILKLTKKLEKLKEHYNAQNFQGYISAINAIEEMGISGTTYFNRENMVRYFMLSKFGTVNPLRLPEYAIHIDYFTSKNANELEKILNSRVTRLKGFEGTGVIDFKTTPVDKLFRDSKLVKALMKGRIGTVLSLERYNEIDRNFIVMEVLNELRSSRLMEITNPYGRPFIKVRAGRTEIRNKYGETISPEEQLENAEKRNKSREWGVENQVWDADDLKGLMDISEDEFIAREEAASSENLEDSGLEEVTLDELDEDIESELDTDSDFIDVEYGEGEFEDGIELADRSELTRKGGNRAVFAAMQMAGMLDHSGNLKQADDILYGTHPIDTKDIYNIVWNFKRIAVLKESDTKGSRKRSAWKTVPSEYRTIIQESATMEDVCSELLNRAYQNVIAKYGISGKKPLTDDVVKYMAAVDALTGGKAATKITKATDDKITQLYLKAFGFERKSNNFLQAIQHRTILGEGAPTSFGAALNMLLYYYNKDQSTQKNEVIRRENLEKIVLLRQMHRQLFDADPYIPIKDDKVTETLEDLYSDSPRVQLVDYRLKDNLNSRVIYPFEFKMALRKSLQAALNITDEFGNLNTKGKNTIQRLLEVRNDKRTKYDLSKVDKTNKVNKYVTITNLQDSIEALLFDDIDPVMKRAHKTALTRYLKSDKVNFGADIEVNGEKPFVAVKALLQNIIDGKEIKVPVWTEKSKGTRQKVSRGTPVWRNVRVSDTFEITTDEKGKPVVKEIEGLASKLTAKEADATYILEHVLDVLETEMDKMDDNLIPSYNSVSSSVITPVRISLSTIFKRWSPYVKEVARLKKKANITPREKLLLGGMETYINQLIKDAPLVIARGMADVINNSGGVRFTAQAAKDVSEKLVPNFDNIPVLVNLVRNNQGTIFAEVRLANIPELYTADDFDESDNIGGKNLKLYDTNASMYVNEDMIKRRRLFNRIENNVYELMFTQTDTSLTEYMNLLKRTRRYIAMMKDSDFKRNINVILNKVIYEEREHSENPDVERIAILEKLRPEVNEGSTKGMQTGLRKVEAGHRKMSVSHADYRNSHRAALRVIMNHINSMIAKYHFAANKEYFAAVKEFKTAWIALDAYIGSDFNTSYAVYHYLSTPTEENKTLIYKAMEEGNWSAAEKDEFNDLFTKYTTAKETVKAQKSTNATEEEKAYDILKRELSVIGNKLTGRIFDGVITRVLNKLDTEAFPVDDIVLRHMLEATKNLRPYELTEDYWVDAPKTDPSIYPSIVTMKVGEVISDEWSPREGVEYPYGVLPDGTPRQSPYFVGPRLEYKERPKVPRNTSREEKVDFLNNAQAPDDKGVSFVDELREFLDTNGKRVYTNNKTGLNVAVVGVSGTNKNYKVSYMDSDGDGPFTMPMSIFKQNYTLDTDVEAGVEKDIIANAELMQTIDNIPTALKQALVAMASPNSNYTAPKMTLRQAFDGTILSKFMPDVVSLRARGGKAPTFFGDSPTSTKNIDFVLGKQKEAIESLLDTLFSKGYIVRSISQDRDAKTIYGQKFMFTDSFVDGLQQYKKITSAEQFAEDSKAAFTATFNNYVDEDGTFKMKSLFNNIKKYAGPGVKEIYVVKFAKGLWKALKFAAKLPFFSAVKIYEKTGVHGFLDIMNMANRKESIGEFNKNEMLKAAGAVFNDLHNLKETNKQEYAKFIEYAHYADAYGTAFDKTKAKSVTGISDASIKIFEELQKNLNTDMPKVLAKAGSKVYTSVFQGLFKNTDIANLAYELIGKHEGTLTEDEAKAIAKENIPSYMNKHWGDKFVKNMVGYNDWLGSVKGRIAKTINWVPRIRKVKEFFTEVYELKPNGEKGKKVGFKFFDTREEANAWLKKVVAKDPSEFKYRPAPEAELTGAVSNTSTNFMKSFATMDSKMEFDDFQRVFDRGLEANFDQPWYGNGTLDDGEAGGGNLERRAKDLIIGYETDDVYNSYTTAFARIAMSFTKLEYGLTQLGNMQQLRELAKDMPELNEHIDEFDKHLRDDLKRATQGQSIAQEWKGVTSVWLMGFRFMSAIVNMTQPLVTGVPNLAKIMVDDNGGSFVAAELDAAKSIHHWAYKAAKLLVDDYMKKDPTIATQIYRKAILGIAPKDWEKTNVEMSAAHKKALDDFSKTGLLQSVFTQMIFGETFDDAFKQRRAEKDGIVKSMEWFKENGLKAFQLAEIINREGTFLASFDYYYTKQKLNADEAAIKASEFVNRTQYMVNRFNTPLMFKKFGPVGTVMYGLMSFPFNFINDLWTHATGKGNANSLKVIASVVGMIFMLGGAGALPFKDLFDWFWKMFFKVKPIAGFSGNMDADLNRLLNSVGITGMAKQVFTEGLPSLTGVTISDNISLRTPFIGGLMGGKSLVASVSGAPGALGERVIKGFGDFASSDPLKAKTYWKLGEALAPEAIAAPMRAGRLYTTGQQTKSGKQVFEDGKPVSPTLGQAAGSALGFKDVDWAKTQERKSSEREIKELWTKRKQLAEESGDVKEIQKFNQKLIASKIMPLVTPIKIGQNRDKPNKNLTMFQMAEKNRGF